ncbi:zinc finger BED domain-containing protein 1-like [Aphis craccivora]|uniref:Zinc finger BED domain-containing protein 1-like n=1 Tax=Aphis craccivora TaxID=307492 RepID=A0A6G0YKC9_APHCR|nr:zinc finger BED domain-containing protein 1-like [Aphis craccivora]
MYPKPQQSKSPLNECDGGHFSTIRFEDIDLSKRSRLNFEFEENIPEDPSSNNEIISASMYSNSGGLTTSLSNRDISPLIHCLPSSSSCPQLYKISYYLSKPVMPGLHYAFYRQTLTNFILNREFLPKG